MPPKHDMGAQPIYDITIAAVAAIKTTSALRRQLPLTVDTLKKNLEKAKRTSFNIEEFDPNQPDSNVILLRAQFDTRKNMEQLQVALNKLIQLDQQWQNLLMTATDKTEQTDETNKWSEKKYGTENATGYLQIIDDADNEVFRLRIEEKQISSLQNRPTTDTGNPITMPTPATQQLTPQIPQIQLPPLQPATFNGDPTKWGYFWQRFQPIHDLPTLPRAQKLHYLSSALEGSAAKTIASLPITDENYDVAVDRLKKTYGDDEELTTQLLLNLYKFPKAADDVRACRKTFDSLELLLQQLKAKNENIDLSTIRVQWSEKIPGWLLEAANNNMPRKTTFDDLREEVNRVLTNRERFSGKPEKVTVNAVSVNDKKAASKSTTKSATKTPDNRQIRCAFCNGDHHGSTCTQIASITERWKFVSTNKLCFVCLKSGHRSNDCRRRRPCFKCKKKHHPALCSEGTEETTENTTAASVLSATKKSVLFQTKNLRIRTNKGNDTALTFFDTGSGSSFILNEAAARLNLTSAGTTKMSVKRFHESNNFEITVKKYNVQILCLNGDILTVPVKGVDSLVDVMKIPMNQDNQSFVYAKPELLIGIDNYWRFFYAKKAKNGIRYVRTRCGDVLSGPIEEAEDEDDDTNVYINAALPGDEEDENDKWLHKRLNVFFELEGTLGFKDDANATEAEIAQSLFDATVQLKDGRFHVSWPFKTQDVKIPLNINAAIAHVERLYKRLLKNGQIHTYTNVLLAHEEKGFIEQVGPLATTPLRASGGNPTTYLTHRGVERDSATTPLRVVFNCSFKLGTKSISFNDVLYIGPNYITNIPGILLRFRCYPTVVTCDIEKAFMQMILNDADRDCCRFLWLIDPTKPPEKENIMIMRYTRPLFGASASPFLLMACLAKLLKEFDTALAKEVAPNLYVDNIIIGADNPQQAYDKFQEVAAMLQTASMPLTQFMSNSAEANKLAGVETAESTKVLGIQFNPRTDEVSVRSTFDEAADNSDPPTKRAILSLINGVYDPLGTISPVVINYKVFLQKQWLNNKGWDDPLSDEDQIEWRRLTAAKSQKIYIPRRITIEDALATELHVFCDASSKAYGAVAYMRHLRAGEPAVITFVSSRARVAPIKKMSIPRLELSSTVVGAQMINSIKTELEGVVQFTNITLWTDSSSAFEWLNGHSIRPPFIQNRVREVRKYVSDIRHVRTNDNPADILSRGTTMAKLITLQKWWHGPTWLSQPDSEWPKPAVEKKAESDDDIPPNDDTITDYPLENDPPDLQDEQRQTELVSSVNLTTDATHNANIVDAERFSTWTSMVMTIFFLLRFVCCTFKGNAISPILLKVLQCAQKHSALRYYAELLIIAQIQHNHPPSDATVKQLNMVTNDKGLWVCLHRLAKANSDGLFYMPHCREAELFVMQIHAKYMHAGVRTTLNELRKHVWIPRGRSFVEKTLRKHCRHCRQLRAKPFALPMMPDLPTERVTLTRPFKHIGVDFAGPYNTKGHDGQMHKSWIVLFTCLVTRAIHLELVNGLDTESFLLAMRRFVARRGRPSTILSDNGTNLKAAAQPVSQHWRSFDTTVINDYLGDNRIEWNFITERAPWKGGVYERMIGVMKKALRAMIGRRIMYNALLNTLLTEVENIVNYRPLTYLENDFDVSDGFRALRPIDFILPWCDNGAPFFDGDDDASNDPDYKVRDSTRDKLIDTWKSSTAHIDRFNKRWLAEYLPMLREVSATAHRQQGTPRSPIVNEVVHIYEEDAPRALWRLGIVTETHVSPDGHVRSASVRTPNGRILQRSIAHLYPLEVHAVEDYQPKVPEPTAEPPTRTLRPRKLAYFIMTLLLMITTSAANPCPANTSDLIPVHVQECLPHGMVIFKDYNDALCWQNVYCGEQHLRQPIDNERHSLCGSPCRCEKWADGCSYYTGPATELSTIGNALTQQLMEDAAPDSGMRMASELQLFDGHRFFVKELKLIHQQVDPKHIDCIGHGDITGSPAYCSQHRCVAHATRFCFYQTHELVLWLHEARTVPIKAWSFVRPYQPHGVSLWSSETDHTVTLSCDHSGIHLKTDADMNMMEIEATGIFFAVSINNKSTIVPLPTQLLVSNIDLKLTMQFNDGLTYRSKVWCPPEDHCREIRCYFCADEFLNPDCRPVKMIFILSVALMATWFMATLILCKCKCRSHRHRRPGGWWRVRKTSDADLYEIHRLLPLHNKVKLSILLVAASLGIANGCSETTSIVAKAEHCTNSAQGWITCQFDDTTELWMASGSTHCLLLKDHENRPLGSIQLEATSFSRCSPTKKRYTRMFKAASSSIKRCPAAGQSTGTTCADTKDDDAIDGLATANSMPGRSGCTESCGCWGCGCFICKEACIFYRYYALPTSDDVYSTFSCESTLPTVRLTASVKSDDKTHHYEQLLTAGQPEEYGDLTFTVVSTPESVHINKDWTFVTRRDQTAVLDTFGQTAATLLQCPTKLDAEQMTKKCVLHPDTCSCRPADSKMACRCQTNEGLRQAFQDAPLPLHTPQGWLRSTNGELLMGQTGLINIIVSSQKFTLTTMVDRNRCVNVKASIAGCYNCEQGATVEMSCKTDYGEALAHVECGSFHFAIHCMHEVRTQRIQVLAKTAETDEQCQLRCPAGSSSFNLRGLLYQPAATDPWSIAPHASKSTSWFGQAARSLAGFFTASLMHFGLIAVGAVILIVLIKWVL